MKIKRPYSIALRRLLALGLLFLWIGSSANTRSNTIFSLSCEKVESSFEGELEEEVRESSETDFLHDLAVFDDEASYFTQLSCLLDVAVADRNASHPSGWEMPLRI